MDHVLGRLVEHLRATSRLRHLEVDVARRLVFAERTKLVPHGYAVEQIGMSRASQRGPQRVLADQQDLQRRPDVQGGADQQPQVRERGRVEQVRFVEHQEQRSLGAYRSFQDLLVDAVLATSRDVAQLGDDELEHSRRGEMAQMAVDRLAMLCRQTVQELLEQRGFAHARGARHQSQDAVRDQVFQASEPFGHAAVLPQRGHGGVFRKRLACKLEVFKVHQSFLSNSRD